MDNNVFDGRLFAPETEMLRLTIFLTKEGQFRFVKDEFDNLVINIEGIEVLNEYIVTEQGEIPTGRVAGINVKLDESITPDRAPLGTRALTPLDLTWHGYPRSVEVTYRVDANIEGDGLQVC